MCFPQKYATEKIRAFPVIIPPAVIKKACGCASRVEVKFIPKMAATVLDKAVEKVPTVKNKFIRIILFRIL